MTRPPLDGVRILAVSQFGAGPFGTQVLADMGAEIIKIEDPETGGDVSRYVPSYLGDRDSLYFQSFIKTEGAVTAPTRAPRLGEHTDAVLTDLLSYGPATIAALRSKGAIG